MGTNIIEGIYTAGDEDVNGDDAVSMILCKDVSDINNGSSMWVVGSNNW
jgi:hypothetical protein